MHERSMSISDHAPACRLASGPSLAALISLHLLCCQLSSCESGLALLSMTPAHAHSAPKSCENAFFARSASNGLVCHPVLKSYPAIFPTSRITQSLSCYLKTSIYQRHYSRAWVRHYPRQSGSELERIRVRLILYLCQCAHTHLLQYLCTNSA